MFYLVSVNEVQGLCLKRKHKDNVNQWSWLMLFLTLYLGVRVDRLTGCSMMVSPSYSGTPCLWERGGGGRHSWYSSQHTRIKWRWKQQTSHWLKHHSLVDSPRPEHKEDHRTRQIPSESGGNPHDQCAICQSVDGKKVGIYTSPPLPSSLSPSLPPSLPPSPSSKTIAFSPSPSSKRLFLGDFHCTATHCSQWAFTTATYYATESHTLSLSSYAELMKRCG